MKVDRDQYLALRKKLDKIGLEQQLGPLEKGFVQATAFVEGELAKNVMGKYLKVRTGRLSGSIQSQVFRTQKNEVIGLVGSGVRTGARVKYATILETGGIIRPKRAKWLTIPLPRALTLAGATKQPRARDFANTFFAKVRNNLFIFQKVGKNIFPLFVLKKQVKIPEFAYMRKTLSTISGKVMEILYGTIDKALKEGAK